MPNYYCAPVQKGNSWSLPHRTYRKPNAMSDLASSSPDKKLLNYKVHSFDSTTNLFIVYESFSNPHSLQENHANTISLYIWITPKGKHIFFQTLKLGLGQPHLNHKHKWLPTPVPRPPSWMELRRKAALCLWEPALIHLWACQWMEVLEVVSWPF